MSILNQLNNDLYLAVCDKNLLQIKLLLKLGADVHASNGALIIQAVFDNSLEVCKYLISYGFNLKKYQNPTLYWAVKRQNKEACRLLIESGCEKQTALSFARGKNYTQEVDYTDFIEFLSSL